MSIVETIINYSDQFSFCFTLSKNDDKDRNLIGANKNFLELTGYKWDEIKGRNCNFLQGELTQNQHIENIRESFKLEKPSFQDILNYKKNGQMFINRLIIIPMNSNEKKYLLGLQNNMRDVNSKEDMKNIKLLSYKNIELSPGDVAHYINNPLTIFINAVQSNKPEVVQKSLKRIKDFIINIDNQNKYPTQY